MSKISVIFELYDFDELGLEDSPVQIPAQLKELPKIDEDLNFMTAISKQNGTTGTYTVVEVSHCYDLDVKHKEKYSNEDGYNDHAQLLTVFIKAVVRNADSIPKLDSTNEKFRITD